VNLNGGTVRANSVSGNTTNGTSIVNFNGGTLQARQDTATFVTGLSRANVRNGGAVFDTNGFDVTVGQSLLHSDIGGDLAIDGGLTKTGAGRLALSGGNTYTGITAINQGTLALSGTGSIANSSQIVIGSGATLDITGLAGSFSLGANQTLSGTGTLLATGKTIVADGTLSPGSSPGTAIQDGGVLQLAADANYNWQVYDASGVAGTGYDTTSLINGAELDLSLLTSVDPYNINLWSLSGIGPDVNGDATGFNSGSPYSWTLFSQDSAISGFSADLFAINVGATNGTSGFSNSLGGGSFTVSLNGGGDAIMLNFIPVPEPSTLALLAAVGGLAGIGLRVARRRRF
jgi:autotransporter-associated beta strand protein